MLANEGGALASLPVVLIGHQARRGKDTVAKWLAKTHGYEILHWADALYEECRGAEVAVSSPGRGYGTVWINDDVYPEERYPFLWKTVFEWAVGCDRAEEDIRPDMVMNYVEGMPVKDACMLQWWGTEYRRRLHDEDYWVNKLALTLAMKSMNGQGAPGYVIPDTRFTNEFEFDKYNRHWMITSGNRPMTIQRVHVHRSEAIEDTGRDPYHPSEVELCNAKWDKVIHNSSDLDYLYNQCEVLWPEPFPEGNEK